MESRWWFSGRVEGAMERARSCGETGLKKGPWSQEEDEVLVSYIRTWGHGNWRALPQRAGLARCGKSCRLRWVNYLRPDIKRGNFTQAEEDTIIALHEELGNRWSAIAARLPGRTDNEIKNVWHTHLKKRATRRGQSSKQSKSRGADSSQQSSSEVSLTLEKMNDETEENSIPWDEFLKSLDDGDLLPRVDDGMDFWRRVLMGEEGLDSMIF